jgi:hypothetical protein
MNQFGGPGGIQGVNNFGANHGVKNPDSPQMESIYRGKVFWGKQNPSERVLHICGAHNNTQHKYNLT